MPKAQEFWKENHHLLFTNEEKYHEIFVPKDIFHIINNTLTVNGSQKAFIFCAYCLVKFVDNFCGVWLTNPDIKELWGYRRDNKDLDKILKRGGIMDKIGLTETKTEGIDSSEFKIFNVHSNKIQHKRIKYNETKSDIGFFRINALALMECMVNPQLGAVAFTIYSFICNSHYIQGRGSMVAYAKLSTGYIKDGTGISKRTIEKYISALKQAGLLQHLEPKREEDYFGDFLGYSINRYKPTDFVQYKRKKQKEEDEKAMSEYMKMKREERNLKYKNVL